MLQRECIRRDYVGPGDLPTLIRFLQRTWSPDSRWHIGDLAWDLGLSADDDDGQRMSLWERDGSIVAWGWLAVRAIVYGRGDDDYPVPRRAYQAMGFTPHGRTVIYRPSGS